MRRAAAVCAVVVLTACGESPQVHVALRVKNVEDLGLLPLPSEITVGRDGGYSGVLGGKVLWTFGETGVLAPPDANQRNYLALEHAELDSPDGTQIVISYSRPTTPFAGDVRLARVTLE
jgi:hypothetical protein